MPRIKRSFELHNKADFTPLKKELDAGVIKKLQFLSKIFTGRNPQQVRTLILHKAMKKNLLEEIDVIDKETVELVTWKKVTEYGMKFLNSEQQLIWLAKNPELVDYTNERAVRELKATIKSGHFNINDQSDGSYHLLYYAARAGNIGFIKALKECDQNFEVEAKNHNFEYFTPGDLAAKAGHIETVELLIEYGESENFVGRDNRPWSYTCSKKELFMRLIYAYSKRSEISRKRAENLHTKAAGFFYGKGFKKVLSDLNPFLRSWTNILASFGELQDFKRSWENVHNKLDSEEISLIYQQAGFYGNTEVVKFLRKKYPDQNELSFCLDYEYRSPITLYKALLDGNKEMLDFLKGEEEVMKAFSYEMLNQLKIHKTSSEQTGCTFEMALDYYKKTQTA
ncbi:MAG: hypothetical protein ChlgKO_01030 [Chlamydiales bacterium]